jgi:hypothetical protein
MHNVLFVPSAHEKEVIVQIACDESVSGVCAKKLQCEIIPCPRPSLPLKKQAKHSMLSTTLHKCMWRKAVERSANRCCCV